MTTTKKLVIAVVALSLALIAFAGTTLAWLTAESSEVENTFTYGKVALTLDEAKVDEYGDPVTGAARVTENQYKLIPGEEYTKDPIVHVTEESEEFGILLKGRDQMSYIPCIYRCFKIQVEHEFKVLSGYGTALQLCQVNPEYREL